MPLLLLLRSSLLSLNVFVHEAGHYEDHNQAGKRGKTNYQDFIEEFFLAVLDLRAHIVDAAEAETLGRLYLIILV